uniref:Secreted protein n=1 Tax=Echinococcus granulosus TaxID=6210 RepID=A0A068WN87_ECHGR|nr:hypothetical protein EgrG_000161800 [Echinococcus granulosus]
MHLLSSLVFSLSATHRPLRESVNSPPPSTPPKEAYVYLLTSEMFEAIQLCNTPTYPPTSFVRFTSTSLGRMGEWTQDSSSLFFSCLYHSPFSLPLHSSASTPAVTVAAAATMNG